MTEYRNYKLLVYSLFLLSGVSGLIYQIVWTRMLVLVFGNTMLATATVLSAFMGGLAAGSYILGRYIDRKPRSLLQVYAVLEAGIGIFALLFPFVIDAAMPLYTYLFRAVEGSIVSLNLIRFLVCFLIIGVPTFLMGGTLPVLIKRFTRSEDTIGSETGFLYGLNTVGAVLGTFSCGYFLLRFLGMQHTTWIAVAINLGVAGAAWLLAKSANEKSLVSAAESASAHEPGTQSPYSPFVIKMVLVGIAISGFCGLAYEVFWTRMLNMFLHNNIYSFTAILGTFLIGIAVGSLFYARVLARSKHQIPVFVILQLGIGIISFATPFIFRLFHSTIFNRFDETLTLVKTALVMLPPTIMMGIAVPLAIQICRKGVNKEGTSVGTVYAVNTIGAILGAFLAGFVLLPLTGLHKGVLIVASLNLIAAVLPLIAVSRSTLRPVWAAGAVGIIALLFITAPQHLFKSLFQAAHPYADIVYYQEGRIANVVVYDFKNLGYKDFHLNAVNEASSRLWHVQLFKLLGLLPTVLHEEPDDALMIAFGAGMSAGATASNIKSLDCVDLNPDIKGIAEAYTRENLDVYNQPNFHQVVNDGRNALLLSDREYSMIISDATNPKMFDSWTLYSQEFYELVKSRLKPGGIFCQWALIPLPADAIKTIFNTFRSAFPHMSVWVIHGSSQILMLGTPERLNIDYAELSERLEPLYEKSGLAEFGIDSPEKFLSFFALGEDGVARMLDGFEKVSTDNLPYAQFIVSQDSRGIDNCLDIVRYQESIRNYIDPGSGVPGDFPAKMSVYEDLARRLNTGFLTGDQSKFSEAVYVAQQSALYDANVEHHINACPEKIRHFELYLGRNPDDLTVRNSLGVFYLNSNRPQDAEAEFGRALQLSPDHTVARLNLARAQARLGKFDDAVENLLQAKYLKPTKSIYDAIPVQMNRVRAMRKSAAFPDSVNLLVGLASAEYADGDIVAAVNTLRRAISMDSANAILLNNFAMLCERHEFVADAAWAYSRLLQITSRDLTVESKYRQFSKLALDSSALRTWESSRLVIPVMDHPAKSDDTHPHTCDEALAIWNDADPSGAVEEARLRRAAELYVQSTEINPDDVHAYIDAAAIYELLGDIDRAAGLWTVASRKRPDLPYLSQRANILRATSLLAKSNFSGCERAEQLSQLALNYRQLNEPEQAVVYLREATKLCPGSEKYANELSTARMESGIFHEKPVASGTVATE